jgi:ketosteroid isomerase-like protein
MTIANPNSTEAVLGRHLQALMQRDLDTVMKDYANNAVIFTPNGPAKGPTAIRAGFEGLLGAMTPEAFANFKLIKQDVDGEYAYIVWSAVRVVPFGGDTFHVRNGKIVSQSFVGQMVS